MDTALTQKFPFILDRNLAKANCTENHVSPVLIYIINDRYSRITRLHIFPVWRLDYNWILI